MNIQSYTTKTGKTGYILKGAHMGIDSLTGEQIRTTIRGRTKKEAHLKLKNKIKEFENNGCTTKKETTIKTFNDLIDAWLIYYVKTVKSGTYYTVETELKRYIRPLIGKYKLEKITPALMQNKVDDFISKEAGHRKDYKFILSLIKRIFKYGVSLNLLESNPMDRKLIHNSNEAGIPNIGLHRLRHTHATMYVNAGVDYKIIQERLVHQNISMTMDIYAHALPENKRSSLDNVINFISNS